MKNLILAILFLLAPLSFANAHETISIDNRCNLMSTVNQSKIGFPIDNAPLIHQELEVCLNGLSVNLILYGAQVGDFGEMIFINNSGEATICSYDFLKAIPFNSADLAKINSTEVIPEDLPIPEEVDLYYQTLKEMSAFLKDHVQIVCEREMLLF